MNHFPTVLSFYSIFTGKKDTSLLFPEQKYGTAPLLETVYNTFAYPTTVMQMKMMRYLK